LKASNINVNSTRKISDHKIYALKVERVPNSFENLNSFEMTLKCQKQCKYIKNAFFGVFIVFLLFFDFFCKFIKNMNQKLDSNIYDSHFFFLLLWIILHCSISIVIIGSNHCSMNYSSCFGAFMESCQIVLHFYVKVEQISSSKKSKLDV
jgi:cellulose synthase/poly-beta-1,6-N-acetylglucosamine synthase-like glycosyltransferase